ncbi:MAG: DUF4402 domain-containing protein [Candidatus Wallbacteria bacterium]|nr:DUF4402 domain-containing protein [Candidatus Wallbacteria bacterium]
MNKKAFLLLCLSVSLLFPTLGLANEDEDFDVQCIVLASIMVDSDTMLDFGTVVSPAAADALTIYADGSPQTWATTDYSTIPGVRSTVVVSGPASQNYQASLIDATTTLDDGLGNTITVDTFTVDGGGGEVAFAIDPLTNTFALDAGGAHTFYIGATANFVGGEIGGTYAGVNTIRVVFP